MKATRRLLIVAIAVAAVMTTATPISSNHSLRPLAARHSAASTPRQQASSQQMIQTRSSSVPLGTVFDLSELSDTQQKWARGVLNGDCDYDWARLVSGLDGRKVKIQIGEPPARAMFYPRGPRVVIHRYYFQSDRAEASRLLAWESAHAIDFYALSEDQREDVTRAFHDGRLDDHGWLEGPYEEQIGEALMEGFVAAFCPSLRADSTFSHATTDEIAQEIREIL